MNSEKPEHQKETGKKILKIINGFLSNDQTVQKIIQGNIIFGEFPYDSRLVFKYMIGLRRLNEIIYEKINLDRFKLKLNGELLRNDSRNFSLIFQTDLNNDINYVFEIITDTKFQDTKRFLTINYRYSRNTDNENELEYIDSILEVKDFREKFNEKGKSIKSKRENITNITFHSKYVPGESYELTNQIGDKTKINFSPDSLYFIDDLLQSVINYLI